MNIFRSFNENELRLNLKLAETRIEQIYNKKINVIKKQRSEIVELLRQNKQEELARIRTEHMVREDFNAEVLQILRLHCALLKERTKLLEVSKTIPHDMKETVATLVYASDRVSEVDELRKIRDQLMLKFKKELTTWLATDDRCRENVNERVYERLSPRPPNAFIVTSYMKHIAEENDLEWRPSEDFAHVRFDQPPPAPTGTSIFSGAASGIQAPYYVTDGSISSTPSQGSVQPLFKGPGGDGGMGQANPALMGGTTKVSSLFDTPLAPLPSSTPPAGGGGRGGGGGAAPALGAATKAAASAAAERKKADPKNGSEFLVLGEEVSSKYNLNPAPAPVTQNTGAVPDFDELQARFEALRKGE